MSDRTPYEQLGVGEDASFDEIKEARDRLFEEHSGDRQLLEKIETAYDAVLMDRLRLRQQGKIKVPERIRFPERVVPEAPANVPSASSARTPGWLKNALDTPSQADILLPAGIFLGLCLLALQAPSIALAVGAGVSLYFLNRKENRFGRAVLLTLVSLLVGVLLGGQLAALIQPQLGVLLSLDTLAAWIAFFFLWLTDSFLK
ncbi:MAG TPA: CPP1-like family protein [Oscillatoriales cyanobacterium M59_W2019_021]|nr:MAG: molecular chaperone DnaJ [Cyanobacteria bacterium J055]HIK31159.1 CPP1-like family protein [Oscillatoriales cyanobacterium M4454_W2019_049]HIK52934.1 CPP1-like family protein [Oscillatoriales cyanobacterium M59_W2019_021]